MRFRSVYRQPRSLVFPSVRWNEQLSSAEKPIERSIEAASSAKDSVDVLMSEAMAA